MILMKWNQLAGWWGKILRFSQIPSKRGPSKWEVHGKGTRHTQMSLHHIDAGVSSQYKVGVITINIWIHLYAHFVQSVQFTWHPYDAISTSSIQMNFNGKLDKSERKKT